MVNLQELNKTISDLESEIKKFKSISEVYSELSRLKSDLGKIQAVSQDGSEKIKKIAEKLDRKLADYDKLLSEIENNNKNFHKELEQHINSKLEKHKSDIQVEIRNEGTQIQRGFENSLTQNFNNLQSKIQEVFSKQGRQLTLLKILLFIVIACCLGLGVTLFLR
jgi:CHASE3 domain sensor protein